MLPENQYSVNICAQKLQSLKTNKYTLQDKLIQTHKQTAFFSL